MDIFGRDERKTIESDDLNDFVDDKEFMSSVFDSVKSRKTFNAIKESYQQTINQVTIAVPKDG